LFHKKNILPLFFLLIAILAFWQVFFLQNGLKWDVIDSFLPARYFVSESLRNGIIPLWNPYLFLGTPSYGDMVSVWNPEVWFVSLFTTYSNITLQFVFIAYIFFAGWGMFKLLQYFNVPKHFAFAGGVAYMLSGFMIGNAQNLSAIAGAAWIPFVVLYYWQFLQVTNWKNLFPLLFFLYLMIFNGYPGLTIILGYLLLSFFVVELIVKIKRKENWLQFLKFHFFLSFLLSGIAAVLMISFFQVAPFIGQYGGGTLQWAEMHPFSPHSLITFLLPLAGVKSSEYFDTDVSMTNAYVGVLTLIFFVAALLTQKKNRFLWTIIVFGMISLLASFGEYLPVRGWFFHYLPLMNVFRYPAFFRLFAIFAVVFTSFYTLETLLSKKRIFLLISMSVISGFLMYFTVIHFNDVYFAKLNLLDTSIPFSERLATLSFNDTLFFQSVFQLSFIGLTVILWWWLRKKRVWNWILSILVILDLMVATQINSSFTVYSNKSPKMLAQTISELPMGYSLPSDRDVVYNSEKSGEFISVWRNTNLFHKRVSPYGFGSFILKNYTYLTDSFPTFSKSIFHHPSAYFSSQILPINQMSDSCGNKNILFVNQSVFDNYKDYFQHPTGYAANKIIWQEFSPNRIKLISKTVSPQVLVLMQNYFPYWKVFVDGQPAEAFPSNLSLLSVVIPKGTHTVSFSFEPPLVKGAFYCGIILLFLLFLFYVFKYHGKTIARKRKWMAALLALVLIFFVRGKLDDATRKQGDSTLALAAINHLTEKVNTKHIAGVFDVNDGKQIIRKIRNDSIQVSILALNNKYYWNRLSRLLDTVKSDYFFYGTFYKSYLPEIEVKIREKFPTPIYQIKSSTFNFTAFSRQTTKDENIVLNQWDFMEGYPAGWSNSQNQITTDKAFSWQKSNVISKTNPYSVSYQQLNTTQLDSGRQCMITMTAQVFLPDDASGVIVCSIADADSSLLWTAQDLNPFFEKRNQWTFVGKTFIIQNNFPQNIPIKVYIWNNGEVPFYIDDIHLITNY